MLLKQFAVVSIPAILSGLLPAQRTWIVDADNRAGTDFTDIPPAVAAAAPGDIIRLRLPTSAVFYSSPANQFSGPHLTKPLQIIGDDGPVLPSIGDGWYVSQIPADTVFAVRNVRIQSGTISFGGFSLRSCSGAIVLDNIVAGNIAVSGTYAEDCALVVLSHWTMDYKGSTSAIRSKMMISDCVLRSTHFALGQNYWGTFGYAALNASEAHVVISRSTLAGASANRDIDAIGTPYYLNAHPAIRMCKSNIQIGKGCTLEAGAYYYGGSNYISEIDCYLSSPPPTPPIVCSMAIDPGTVLIGPLLPPGQVIYDFTPQTGLSYQVSPTTLTVTHFANPQSLCILAIGTLTTTPWTNIVGPVFIDPIGASQFWDPAPTTGTLVRTFPIPPGLPRGYQATLQAFELQQSGAIRTSNAGIVAVP